MRCIRRSLVRIAWVARGFLLPRGGVLRLFSVVLVLALAGCGSYSSSSRQVSAPPDPQKAVETVAPIPTPMDTFRALSPPEGLKFQPLFSEPARGDEERFKRIEDALQTMRNDFDTIVPSLVRLVAVEKDMRDLVQQLQTLTNDAQPVPPPPPIPAESEKPIPGKTKAASKAPPAAKALPVTPEAAPKGNKPPEGAASLPFQPLALKTDAVRPGAEPLSSGGGQGEVRRVRIADHSDRTRLVLDMSAPTAFSAVLQNGGRQLVIDLPQMSWAWKLEWTAQSGTLIAGYKYEGGKLHVDLIAPAVIKFQQILPRDDDFRLVIDLAGFKEAP